MRAGRLRHRITILRPVESRSADGGVVIEWEPFMTRHAHIEGLRGRELFEQASAQARATHKIEMRHAPDVTPRHAVDFKGRRFEIVHVDHVRELREMTLLMVTETV